MKETGTAGLEFAAQQQRRNKVAAEITFTPPFGEEEFRIEDLMRQVREKDAEIARLNSVIAKPEAPAPATECACRDRIIAAFRSAFYVRGDHRYSGVEIYEWLRTVDAAPCPCAELREELERTRRDGWEEVKKLHYLVCGYENANGTGIVDKLRAELAAANERAEKAEAQLGVAIKGMSDLESECEFHATDRARLHAWFELQFGESLRGREFPAKCSMASRVIEDQRDTAQAGWREAVEVLRAFTPGLGKLGPLDRWERARAIVRRFDAAQGGKDANA